MRRVKTKKNIFIRASCFLLRFFLGFLTRTNNAYLLFVQTDESHSMKILFLILLLLCFCGESRFDDYRNVGNQGGSHSSRLPETPDPVSPDELKNYDEDFATRVSKDISAHHAGSSIGLCYKYVGESLDRVGAWPRGFYDDGSCSSTDLNCNIWASSFAYYWKTSLHQAKIPYQPVFLRENKNGEEVKTAIDHTSKAPKGSILVWKKCNGVSSAAGHIAIVTEKGREAVSDFVHGTSDVCEESNLIGIFIPIKK
jgi:hypothetical protein